MVIQEDVQVNRIHRLDGDSSLKAFVDISVGNFTIKGLRIIEGKNGLFLGMPRTQGKDGKWYNTIMLDSRESHQELTDLVLEAYNC